MERWIIRGMAVLCGFGALGLAWAFGAFSAIPLRDGRLFGMSGTEIQLVAIPFVGMLAVGWGALHLLGLADREENPRAFRLLRIVYGFALLAAIAAGASWSLPRVLAA
ncbi:MAG: hypothetical protein RBT86_00100 [Azospira sp.]|jgi:hypothetical protein|nr:hypothetical protein [Azospira sp.]